MKARGTIFQITLAGTLTALAVLLGAFAHFPILGGHVYLVGVVVFLMPVMLKLPYALISTIVSVLLTDVISGWVTYTWISIIAYTVGVTIIWVFSFGKFKFMYMIGMLVAAMAICAIYFFLETIQFGRGMAINDLWATMIQFAIVLPIVGLIYTPIRLLIHK